MAFENFQIGGATVRYAGVFLGHTNENGITVTYEPDIHMHMSGKYGTTPVKASIVGKKVTVEVNLAEITLTNFEKTMSDSEITASLLNIGGVAGSALDGAELVIIPNAGNILKWTFRNAVITSAVSQEYSPSNEQILKVTYTAMVDEDRSDATNLVEVS